MSEGTRAAFSRRAKCWDGTAWVVALQDWEPEVLRLEVLHGTHVDGVRRGQAPTAALNLDLQK